MGLHYPRHSCSRTKFNQRDLNNTCFYCIWISQKILESFKNWLRLWFRIWFNLYSVLASIHDHVTPRLRKHQSMASHPRRWSWLPHGCPPWPSARRGLGYGVAPLRSSCKCQCWFVDFVKMKYDDYIFLMVNVYMAATNTIYNHWRHTKCIQDFRIFHRCPRTLIYIVLQQWDFNTGCPVHMLKAPMGD